jgi:hypothetical protein
MTLSLRHIFFVDSVFRTMYELIVYFYFEFSMTFSYTSLIITFKTKRKENYFYASAMLLLYTL